MKTMNRVHGSRNGYQQHLTDPLAAYEDVKERAYRHGVEAMRAACIKAVAPWCDCTAPTTTSGEHDDWCLSADLGNSLREVEP